MRNTVIALAFLLGGAVAEDEYIPGQPPNGVVTSSKLQIHVSFNLCGIYICCVIVRVCFNVCGI
jgi:hypothetical protein